jgi:hypothetical protein
VFHNEAQTLFSKMKTKTKIAKMFFFFVLMIVVPALFCLNIKNALAAATDCGGNFQNIAGVCFPSNTQLSEEDLADVLVNLMTWLITIFGILALIAFIISGIQYLTAAGDEDQAETAKRNAKYALIGIIIGLSGLIILTAITNLLGLVQDF